MNSMKTFRYLQNVPLRDDLFYGLRLSKPALRLLQSVLADIKGTLQI